MPTTTTNALDALLYVRNGFFTARWNFPAAIGSPLGDPAGIGSAVALSYSFLSASPVYYQEPGVRSFDNVEKTAAQQALASIASIAGVSFQEVLGVGQLTFAMSTQSASQGAFAFIPSYAYALSGANLISSVTESELSGDVWVNGALGWVGSDWQPGRNGYATLLHEIGHGLGLRHPFEVIEGGFTLSPALDNERYTVMSYTYASNTNIITVEGTQSSYNYFWEALRPSTLMPLDIEALQYLYGANTTTRAGSNTYTWARNAEILETLWDAGGIDTLDLGNQILACVVDLRPGSYSSIALRQTDAQKRAALDLPSWFDAPLPLGTYDGRDNLAIAKGVTIENAIGGAAGDDITGNGVSNALSGGGGDDILSGLAGNDVLNGGLGSDTMRGGVGNDLYIVGQEDDVVEELNGQGLDQINSSLSDLTLPDFVENGRVMLAGAADLKGNDSANTLFAGAGDNELTGGAGVDTASYAYGISGVTGVTLDLRLAVAQNTGGSGLDTLLEIENLTGSSRPDTLIGNEVANVLRGGLGQDLLNGLGGADKFVFDTRLSLANRDRVIGFVSGVDKIVLDDDIFSALSGTLVGVALGVGNLRIGATPLDADDYLLYNPTTDLLSYAPTGSGSANLLPVAVIPMGAQAPVAGDFLVVA